MDKENEIKNLTIHIEEICDALCDESFRDYISLIMVYDLSLCSDREIAELIIKTKDMDALKWVEMTHNFTKWNSLKHKNSLKYKYR